MEEDEGGGVNTPPNPKVKKRKEDIVRTGGSGEESEQSYLPFFKPNYIRLYPENSNNTEFNVFVESRDKDRIGNKSPIYLNHIFASEVKGVVAIRRINANRIGVVFKQYNTANNFIKNEHFLEKYKIKAFIPAAQIERIGIIRHVPTNISNKELYLKLSSIYEIVAVRRFTKKVGSSWAPLQTVSITFLSNILPNNVQYDLFSYRVSEYIPPLQQCYRCSKFNHSAKVCNGKQRCSRCAGDHSYKDCDKPNELCCVNCGGTHLAVARTCPVKMRKIVEKKEKISYSSVVKTNKNDHKEFPLLPEKSHSVNKTFNKTDVNNIVNSSNVNRTEKSQTEKKSSTSDVIKQVIGNNYILMALVQTLVQLGNKMDDVPITTTSIKQMLLKNLSS